MYSPASAFKTGPLRSPNGKSYAGSAQFQPKKLHYRVDGTGRDSYIMDTDGGFTTRHIQMNSRDHYVANLRSYSTNQEGLRRTLYQNSQKQHRISPSKDHFIEGQVSVRSPRARNEINLLKNYQDVQNQRLSRPKLQSVGRFDKLVSRNPQFNTQTDFAKPQNNFLKSSSNVKYADKISSRNLSPLLSQKNHRRTQLASFDGSNILKKYEEKPEILRTNNNNLTQLNSSVFNKVLQREFTDVGVNNTLMQKLQQMRKMRGSRNGDTSSLLQASNSAVQRIQPTQTMRTASPVII